MSGTVQDLPEDSLLAAEYVLGVLDAAGRRAVDARAAAEPGLAAEIGTWERMLAPLALLVPPVEPPAALWPRLERAIAPGANVVAFPSARSVRLWQGATAAALALAACFAVVAVLPRAPQPVAVAALAPLNGAAPAFVVRVLPGGGLNVAALAPEKVPAGRDLELWALPAGATAPTSLGVLPQGGATIAASSLTAPGGKLLVSLEPKGGSPTGKPTGPVLYGGVITQM
jgi:anti-sigma-K factor RskA